MKKNILISVSVLMLAACNSNTQNISVLMPEMAQVNTTSSKNYDNPDFIRKMKDRANYKATRIIPTSICGENDLQHVNFYDGKLGQPVEFVMKNKPAVGAMETGNSDTSSKFCSGTLISENLFLTAGHCVDSSATKNTYVSFNYEKAKDGKALLKQKHFKVVQVVEDALNSLDFSVVKLDGAPGKEFGWTKLNAVTPEKENLLTIIQHPSGEPKQVEVGHMAGVEGNYLSYGDLDTEPGSSGSGVLDNNGAIVGVHTNGGCGYESGTNKGVLLSEIIKASKVIKELSTIPGRVR